MIIGLYAGVGAGKSTIANLFKDFGSIVLDADQSIREVYKDPEVKTQIINQFGSQSWLEKEPNRAFLSQEVFTNIKNLKQLEKILHPKVVILLKQQILQYKETDLIILDIPLLISSPLQQLVDVGIFIDTPIEIRNQRCLKYRKWPIGEVEKRESFQPSLEDKKKVCNFIIINDENTTLEDLKKQVEKILNLIKK